MYRIPVSDWADFAVMFCRTNFRPVFRWFSGHIEGLVGNFESLLAVIPVLLFIILIVALAWKFAGRGLAFFALAGFLLILNIGLWEQTMCTLALVLTATFISLLIGIPLGILASRSEAAWKVLRPVLDIMQTMPIFVYLLPALMLFGIGPVPAVIATIVFAAPPAIRLTNLGIRQVPQEVMEAALAFGSTPMQILARVQLPLALPSILAGVNQCIMLSLSMVVISAMIGAGGLGGVVYRAISRVEIGSGFEGGIGVVIIAIILDRLTQSFGKGPVGKEQS